eukprot:comp23099_c0_seq2/m.37116 comp23099_c0_seq2/g.37116  ORF comp23099_c0_seq2/g.37116 comp23099_c0_seq2/m.37116 type:complete len:442 (-) comp23099_c0_seq2:123-1448(-)
MSETYVTRDPLYVGRPVRENAAIVTRIAPSFWRFGTFEVFAVGENGVEGPFVGDVELCKTMLDYFIRKHYAHIWQEHAYGHDRYVAFFEEIVRRTAELVAKWQCVGFVHGVLNTDNMSLLGLTIDYGPFGFLDTYNPHYVPNYSDTDERYSYENQPAMCEFDLKKLAEALSLAVPLEDLHPALKKFMPTYEQAYHEGICKKLGLQKSIDGDEFLIASLLDTMLSTGADYTNVFRSLSRIIVQINGTESPEAKATHEGLLGYIMTQLDNAGEMRSAMPYELDYLRVLSNFPSEHDVVIRSLTGKSLSYFQTRLTSVERATKLASTSPFQKEEEDRQKWQQWIKWYQERVQAEIDFSDTANLQETVRAHNAQRVTSMNRTNPKFCLRNYMAQNAFEKARVGDFSELENLTKVLTRPFDEHEDMASNRYDRRASALRMCVSCSS